MQKKKKKKKKLASSLRFPSRICFTVGYDTQTARVHSKLGKKEPATYSFRSSSFVAVKMEDNPDITSVWYGRLLRLVSIDLSAIGGDNVCAGKYDIAILDWADRLEKGLQVQVFFSP